MSSVDFRAIVTHLLNRGLDCGQIRAELEVSYGPSAPAYLTITRWKRDLKFYGECADRRRYSGRPSTLVADGSVDLVIIHV